MRILITGSSGQIGTNLGLRLMEEGREVLGLDIRENAWTQKIPTRILDLRRPAAELLRELAAEKFDLIVHLAAYAKVHELVVHPERSLENVVMTFQVLELARDRGVPLIFGSSREAYGDVSDAFTSEDRRVVAKSPYSASKISGEAFVTSYALCYGLPVLTYRFSNVYGRYDNDLERMERVTPLFIKLIAEGKQITIFGKEKVLDFTWVDDCVDAIVRGIDRLYSGELKNETINVATGHGTTLEQLAMFIGETLGTKPNVTIQPTRPGEISRYVADIGKARRLLGYAPTTLPREGIRKTIAWAGTKVTAR
ncbi:MAG: NAD-dependent epimerase/dehydratase family protein [Planctomycetota bacterium]